MAFLCTTMPHALWCKYDGTPALVTDYWLSLSLSLSLSLFLFFSFFSLFLSYPHCHWHHRILSHTHSHSPMCAQTVCPLKICPTVSTISDHLYWSHELFCEERKEHQLHLLSLFLFLFSAHWMSARSEGESKEREKRKGEWDKEKKGGEEEEEEEKKRKEKTSRQAGYFICLPLASLGQTVCCNVLSDLCALRCNQFARKDASAFKYCPLQWWL